LEGVIKVWETIKKDPLIKTIVVILIGVLAFGFAFNIMFGAGSTSMEEGSMMSTGYSLGNTLENIIELLIKVVIIGLLSGVLVWIFRTITKRSVNGQGNRFEWLKEDPIIRNVLIMTGAVVVFIFTFYLLREVTASVNGEVMMNGRTTYVFSNMSFSLTSYFTFLLKVMIFIFIITLGYGLVMYLKKNYINAAGIKDADSSDTAIKECPECKGKLESNWKCCPYCGSDMASEKTTVQE